MIALHWSVTEAPNPSDHLSAILSPAAISDAKTAVTSCANSSVKPRRVYPPKTKQPFSVFAAIDQSVGAKGFFEVYLLNRLPLPVLRFLRG